MITPKDLCQAKPGLAETDEEVGKLLRSRYDHATQTRKVGAEGIHLYPTSTRFDGDRT